MSELSSETSDLDARLAELDRRLQAIAVELVPEHRPGSDSVSPPGGPRSTVCEFTVSAGPFASTGALRAFEQTLSAIPGVREVTVRGYEGEDRAIVDVLLAEPIS
jgi:hypothetical protein